MPKTEAPVRSPHSGAFERKSAMVGSLYGSHAAKLLAAKIQKSTDVKRISYDEHASLRRVQFHNQSLGEKFDKTCFSKMQTCSIWLNLIERMLVNSVFRNNIILNGYYINKNIKISINRCKFVLEEFIERLHRDLVNEDIEYQLNSSIGKAKRVAKIVDR